MIIGRIQSDFRSFEDLCVGKKETNARSACGGAPLSLREVMVFGGRSYGLGVTALDRGGARPCCFGGTMVRLEMALRLVFLLVLLERLCVVTLWGPSRVAHKPLGSWLCGAMEALCVGQSCDAPGGASQWVFACLSPPKGGAGTRGLRPAEPSQAEFGEHICSCFFATRKFRNEGEFLAQATCEVPCERLREPICEELCEQNREMIRHCICDLIVSGTMTYFVVFAVSRGGRCFVYRFVSWKVRDAVSSSHGRNLEKALGARGHGARTFNSHTAGARAPP
jgi:hypothetical protein